MANRKNVWRVTKDYIFHFTVVKKRAENEGNFKRNDRGCKDFM